MKIFRKNEILKIKNYFSQIKNISILKYFSDSSKENKQKTKNTLNKKINLNENKFPKPEENISNLLNEMEKETNKNNYNSNIIQKEEILFINNLNNIEAMNDLKLGELILINNQYPAKCLSLGNKINTFALIDRIK